MDFDYKAATVLLSIMDSWLTETQIVAVLELP
jgi:hypothetical protein